MQQRTLQPVVPSPRRYFENELIYQFTPIRALIWLGIVVLLATKANWFPAHKVTGINVRQSLA